MIKRTVKSPGFWIALLLLAANSLAWVYALAPGPDVVQVEPRLAPDVADLRDRLAEGGHSGEPYRIQVSEQQVAETIAWYLSARPQIPFRDPQVTITPERVVARGVAEMAGLRVGISGEAHFELRDGVPYVSLRDLEVAGVAVPGFVRNRIQSEIDAQFGLAQNLPLSVDELVLGAGEALVQGTIR